MGITSITELENRSQHLVELFEVNNQSQRLVTAVPPGQRDAFGQQIPWAANSTEFIGRHLRLDLDGVPRYWLWQAAELDGDHVRFNITDRWVQRGEPVDGFAKPDGDRTMVVFDDGFQLVHFPDDLVKMVREALPKGTFRMVSAAGQRDVPSAPKSAAVAFSTAGPPAERGDTVYRDSGKRYAFRLENGVVIATDLNGTEVELREGISYDTRRLGEVLDQVPLFDLIAASGGRVLAKAAGKDDFYFATMDPLFMHSTASNPLFEVPSAYFKIDPEYNQPGAVLDHLMPPVEGWFGNHPGAERYPSFRFLFGQDLMDLMMVRVRPRVWHRIDARPPMEPEMFVFGLRELMERIAAAAAEAQLSDFALLLQQWFKEGGGEPGKPIEELAPVYEQVLYVDDSGIKVAKNGVDFVKVLDIGVGHVHHYDQYEAITGGELQPMLANQDWLTAYQLFNGPVRDGDGFIDGTCNFYALVQLAPVDKGQRRYAVLFQDEQSYFSQRWRLVDPDDSADAMFSVAAARFHPSFGFDPTRYWSPFEQEHIGARSRMAVAAQVILVTADPDAPVPDNAIFSINYSWSTMDRSWRRRELPPKTDPVYLDEDRDPAEVEPDESRETVYPQTIRLREDMTIVLRGTGTSPGGKTIAGRYVQRYLPATNRLTPLATSAGGRPTDFSHPWKFIPEDAFQLADTFSHLGVYDTVDSRSQYYTLEPKSPVDESVLRTTHDGEWVDIDFTLYRWAPKVSFSAPLHLFTTPSNIIPGVLDRRPPSLHNRQTKLRIVERGQRWIAMHHDKRDDDLLPFEGTDIGAEARMRPLDGEAEIVLHTPARVERPPALLRARFTWDGVDGHEASIVLTPAPGRDLDLVHRLRLSALDLGSGQPVHLLDADVIGKLHLHPSGGLDYRWVPDSNIVPDLINYTTEEGAFWHATSIWVQDIVGHVATPEQLEWRFAYVPPLVRTLIVDQSVTVYESDGSVDTGFDLQPGDEYEFVGSGLIWAGVYLTGDNGPAGWDNLDHDKKFPLHVGNTAYPYALIGRFDKEPWFYVGDQLPAASSPYSTANYPHTTVKRLFLGTNDDAPGNGSGSFDCHVRIWRYL